MDQKKVKNKSSVIIINGRHYDARTGKPLSGQAPAPGGAHHRPATTVPAIHKPASHPGRTAHGTSVYRPTRHIKPHRPEPAHTLMRRAVSKPAPSVKRRIKVQGSLRAGGGRQSSRIITHRVPESYARHSRNHAVKVTHNRLISHFSPELFAVDGHTSLAVYGTNAVNRTAVRQPARPAETKRQPTTDELLEFAVQHAQVPHHRVTRHRRRIVRRQPHHAHHANHHA